MSPARAATAGELALIEDGAFYDFLAEAIRSARRSFWANIFSLNFRPSDDGELLVRTIARALVDARQRGVDVRILLGGNARRFLDLPAGNTLSQLFFTNLGVECRCYHDETNNGSHAKYFLVDNEMVVVGSHNWSPRALSLGVDTSVAARSTGLARAARAVFLETWGRAERPARSGGEIVAGVQLRSALSPISLYERFRTPPKTKDPTWHAGDVRLLPDSAYLPTLLAAIRSARSSLRVSMFFFSNPTNRSHPNYRIVGEILRAHRRGVDTRILVDADREKDVYQSRKINTRVKEYLGSKGIAVRFDAPDRVNHSKFAAIDEERVLAGSHNWTAGSLKRMHDVSLDVRCPEIATRCARLVDRHFRG